MNNNNIKNPFIGLRTYEEVDAIFFRGRKSSTSDLYNMISDNDVVVLHAESGEGKSSLLNAGLFPMLRDERFFPIKISFTEEDYALENPDFDKIVYQRIIESINQINCDSATTHLFRNAPSLDGKVSLLPIDGGDNILSGNEQLRQCAWWLLRNYTLNAYGAPLIPVLVFDQFEEVFTRPKSNIWTEDFFIWLSTTLNDTVPQNVINIVREVIGETEDFPKIRTEKKFKALFALRTEYMGELDYWGIQRHHISVLKNSRYCLKPLTEQEADEVLELQPVFTPQIRNQIKEAIRSSHGSKRLQLNLPAIPAMLLSVVSTTATNNIAQNGQAFDNVTAISGTDLSSDLFTNIIDQFYQKEIASANIPRKVINHIESVLVDDKGKRVRIKADSKELRKSDFEGKYKPTLEQMRLIKCTQINGDEYVELTHDALAKVIANKRIKQADYIAKVKTLGLYILGGITFLLSILFACFYIDAIANYTQKFIVTLPVVGRVVINLFFIRAWIIITAASFSLYIHKKKKRLKIFMDGLLYFIVTYIGFINFFSIREIPLREYSFRVTRQFVESIDCHWFLTTCNCLSLALMLIVGRYLTCSKKILFKIFGILLMAIPILVTAAFYKLIISIAIICVVIFILSPCIFIKDRNSGWLLLMASCLMFINSLVVNGRDVIDTSIFMGIWLAILGIGYLFFKKENKFIHQIGLLKSGNLKQKFPAIRQAFNLYIIVILLIASYYIGLVMDPISSLVGMALICPILSVCTLKLFYKGNSSKNRVSLFVQVLIIEACVTLIWVSQFSFSHLLIVIGVILTLIVVEVLLSLFNKVPLKFNHKINRIFSYIASTLFAVLVGAYFLLGFNYFTTDDFQRMNGKNLVIRMYRSTPHGDLKLQLIKDKSGKIGIRDRKGNIVISPMYDDIYGYDHSFDDIYSDFVTSSNDFNIIFMSNGYPIKWNIFDHLHERNVLTDEFCYHSRGKG